MLSAFSLLIVGCMVFPGLTVLSSPAMAQEGGKLESIQTDVEQEAVVRTTCSTVRLSFASSNNTSQTTTSTTFVNVPDMSVSFTIPGTTSTCITVHYTAVVWTGTGDRLINVRARLDGAVNGFPAEVQFAGFDGDNTLAQAHTFNFVFPNVAPGAHTLRIQWRSPLGGTVYTHERTAIVYHK
jgi:hypothetical protein